MLTPCPSTVWEGDQVGGVGGAPPGVPGRADVDKAIARKLHLARNTVRSAVRSVQPPQYVRAGTGSIVDAVEPQIRGLLSHAHSCSSAVRQRTSLCRLDICATHRR